MKNEKGNISILWFKASNWSQRELRSNQYKVTRTIKRWPTKCKSELTVSNKLIFCYIIVERLMYLKENHGHLYHYICNRCSANSQKLN